MKLNITLSSTPENLLAEARNTTGIDLVDQYAAEPLHVLCDSINSESQLFESGAKDLKSFLLRLLNNRLRMLRDFSAHPEIEKQQIKAPIFICGSTRTGSTKTQRLLASSGDFNWLAFWQSLNPSLITGDRSESPEARIEDADNYVRWFNDASPNAKLVHEIRTHEPEEESFILVHSLMTPVFTGMVEVPSYIQWLLRQDLSAQFHFLKDTLKYLQWQGYADPSKRWVLKSPFYASLEPLLLKVFPDAQLIMTHRHPLETIPSTCSLFKSYRTPYSDASIDSSAVVEGAAIPMSNHLEIRSSMPDIQFLDIAYSEVTHSAERVIEEVYRFIGMELSEDAKQRMLDWEKNHPIHQKGKHKYSLEDFGLTEDEINEQFAGYIELLKRLFG